ncbi:MAG: hypothetical protein AAF184_11700 [Pseudomonadota bacterium]
MKPIVILLLLALFLLVSVGAWLRSAGTRSSTVVLGKALADAQAEEEKRLATNPGPSPLAGLTYRDLPDGASLFRLSRDRVDTEIQLRVEEFRALSAEGRRRFTERLSIEDQYSLIQLAKRSAVFALRERSTEPCRIGLNALAALDLARMDPRDVTWAAAVLGFALTELAADRDQLYDESIALALPAMAEHLTAIREAHREGVSLQDWGYRVVKTSDGPALVETGYDDYAPGIDLLAVAVRGCDELASERYPRVAFEVATAIPEVWFGTQDPHLSETLQRSTGTALVRRSSTGSGEDSLDKQLNLLFIAEFPSEEDAEWLAARAPREVPGQSATVAFSSGRILVVMVSGSYEAGVPAAETVGSLTSAMDRVRHAVVHSPIAGSP